VPKSVENRTKCLQFGVSSALKNGLHVAITFSMRNITVVHRHAGITSFSQGVRALAEVSLVALAFGLAIFLIGLPVALSVRVMYESVSWLAGMGGEMGPIAEAVVSVASVVGGIILIGGFTTGLVGFFRWRRTLREENRITDLPTDRVGRSTVAARRSTFPSRVAFR
jgi:hypothetical protein